MTGRYLHGRHPLDGSYGVWLSKPGINVLGTVNPDDMLISPLKKNEQILTSGVIAVAPGGNDTIYYPEAMSSSPFVQFMVSGNVNNMSYPPFYAGFGASDAVYCTQYPQAATFYNFTTVYVAFFYSIFARSL